MFLKLQAKTGTGTKHLTSKKNFLVGKIKSEFEFFPANSEPKTAINTG